MSNEVIKKELDLLINQSWYIIKTCVAFKKLYSNKNNVKIANKLPLSHIHQRNMIDAIIMGISRFSDPPSTCGQRNLSCRRICANITKEQINDADRKKIECAKNKLTESHKTIKKVRDKEIAHSDLGRANNCHSIPGLKNITDCIDNLMDFIRVAYVICSGNSIDFNYILEQFEMDAEEELAVLSTADDRAFYK